MNNYRATKSTPGTPRRALWIVLLIVAYVSGVALLQPRSDGSTTSIGDRGPAVQKIFGKAHETSMPVEGSDCTLTITQVFDQAIATSQRCAEGSLANTPRSR